MEDTKREGFIPQDVWEHARNAGRELRMSVEALVPPEVGQHGRAARKEMLLAFRGLIDAAIDRIDRKQQAATQTIAPQT
jgi:hypothetical protein